MLLPVQAEQLDVGMLLASVYPIKTGHAPLNSQRLKLTGPFEYVQHRMVSVPRKQQSCVLVNPEPPLLLVMRVSG